ncbi:MAG: hypothetical protein MUF42_02120 [Cytophagaceae bacterium]|jgi:hypothetical protein|nr:hypothetical protein [Cytophagaceae bacterium]
MKLQNSIYSLSLALLLAACTAEQPVLDDSAQLAVEEEAEKGTPILQSNKGILDDFSGEIWSWWVGNDQLTLSKKGDTLKVVAKNVGPKYTPFGREMNLYDLSKGPILKVRMRAEGATAPLIGISLKDVNTFDTNADRPKNKIKTGTGYMDYYFDYTDRWKQSWPNNQKVDETMIREIMIFINPGGAEWTGTLFIDEIKAISPDEMPKKAATVGGIIDDFSEEIYSWWSSSDKIMLERKDEMLHISMTEVGPGYETMGRGIEAMNFNAGAQIIRVKARAEGAVADFRIDLKDKSGIVTNASPVINKIEVSSEFKNYFYNYKGKYTQAWPEAQKVNADAIQEVLFFVNPGGNPGPYTGKVIIDEMEVITEAKMNDLKGVPSSNGTATPSYPMVDGKILIEDFSKEPASWWSGSEKIAFSKDGEALKVVVNGAGPKYEVFGSGLKTLDFTNTPVLKVRIKAVGGDANVRIDVKDSEGNTTNASPNVVRVPDGADYADYYFDFTGKYTQSWPDAKVVNPKQITEMVLFINPGSTPYSGTLFIDDIQLLSPDQKK